MDINTRLSAPTNRGSGKYKRRPLVVALSLALAFALTSRACPIYATTSPNVQPVTVYHDGWKLVNDTYIDTDKLAAIHWQSLEHVHDSDIHTVDDAGKYLTEDLAKLGTRYTRYLTPKEAQDQNQQIQDEVGSIGVEFAMAIDANDKTKYALAADGYPAPVTNASGYPIVQKVFLGTPAALANLLPGDAIAAIDGQSTKQLSQDAVEALLEGNLGSAVELRVVRKGLLYAATLTRAEIETAPIYVRNLPGNITYIRIVSFIGKHVAANFKQILIDHRAASGFIIDIRDNRGGLLPCATEMAAYLLGPGQEVLAIKSRDDTGAVVTEHHHKEEFFKGADVTNNKPIVLLVNEGSASASEVFAGALVDNGRAELVGTKTYGKGCVQQVNPIQEGRGGAINITIANYLTPNGIWPGDGEHEDNRKGLVPKPENILKLSAYPHIEDVVGASKDVDLEKDAQQKLALHVMQVKLLAAAGQ